MSKMHRIQKFFAEKRKHKQIQKLNCTLQNRNARLTFSVTHPYSSGSNQNNIEWMTDRGSKDPVFSNMKWVMTRDSSECDYIVSFLESKLGAQRFVGLDLEYDPCFKKGQSSRTALIQVGVHTGHCLLIQVVQMKKLPSGLEKLLIDPTVVKVGVGIHDDILKIFKDFNVRVENTLDVRAIAPPAQKQGLKALALDHLGTVLPKSKNLVMTKWSQSLSPAKQAYGARDAYVAVLLTKKLVAKKLQIPEDTVSLNDVLQAKKDMRLEKNEQKK